MREERIALDLVKLSSSVGSWDKSGTTYGSTIYFFYADKLLVSVKNPKKTSLVAGLEVTSCVAWHI